jgi:hypothetical protein
MPDGVGVAYGTDGLRQGASGLSSAQANGFRRESERSDGLGRRSAAVGDMGDDLTAGTTTIAAACAVRHRRSEPDREADRGGGGG